MGTHSADRRESFEDRWIDHNDPDLQYVRASGARGDIGSLVTLYHASHEASWLSRSSAPSNIESFSWLTPPRSTRTLLPKRLGETWGVPTQRVAMVLRMMQSSMPSTSWPRPVGEFWLLDASFGAPGGKSSMDAGFTGAGQGRFEPQGEELPMQLCK